MGNYLRNKDTHEVRGPLDADAEEYVELKTKRSALDGRPLWEEVGSAHAPGLDHSPTDADIEESDPSNSEDEARDPVLAADPQVESPPSGHPRV